VSGEEEEGAADSARVFTAQPIYMDAVKKKWTAEIGCEARSEGR
jgi:hypothetical protein